MPGTCYNQRPIVAKGDRADKGEILADGSSMENGEIGIRPKSTSSLQWHGKVYNLWDAIIMSDVWLKMMSTLLSILKNMNQKLVTQNLGPEEITRELPNVWRRMH